MKKEADKVIYVRVPAKLHRTLKRLSIDTGLSSADIIRQYLEYLYAHQAKSKWVLNDTSPSKFQLERPED